MLCDVTRPVTAKEMDDLVLDPCLIYELLAAESRLLYIQSPSGFTLVTEGTEEAN